MYNIREYKQKMNYLYCEQCKKRVDGDLSGRNDLGCKGKKVSKSEYTTIVIEAAGVEGLEGAIKRIEEGEAQGVKDVSGNSGYAPKGKRHIHIFADGHDRAQAIEYLREGLDDIKHGADFCSMHDAEIDPSIPSLYYNCSGQVIPLIASRER